MHTQVTLSSPGARYEERFSDTPEPEYLEKHSRAAPGRRPNRGSVCAAAQSSHESDADPEMRVTQTGKGRVQTGCRMVP